MKTGDAYSGIPSPLFRWPWLMPASIFLFAVHQADASLCLSIAQVGGIKEMRASSPPL